MYKEGPREELEHRVLFRAWQHLQHAYLLPGTAEGFSRCARNVISFVKRPPFSSDGVSQADSDPTPREAAAATGISERRLYDLITKGVVPTRREGGEKRLQPGWREAVRKYQAEEKERRQRAAVNKVFARAWSLKKNIPPASH